MALRKTMCTFGHYRVYRVNIGCQAVGSTTCSLYIGQEPLIDSTSVNICVSEHNGKLFTFATVFAFICHQSELSSLPYTLRDHLSHHVSHNMQNTVLDLRWRVSTTELLELLISVQAFQDTTASLWQTTLPKWQENTCDGTRAAVKHTWMRTCPYWR